MHFIVYMQYCIPYTFLTTPTLYFPLQTRDLLGDDGECRGELWAEASIEHGLQHLSDLLLHLPPHSTCQHADAQEHGKVITMAMGRGDAGTTPGREGKG